MCDSLRLITVNRLEPFNRQIIRFQMKESPWEGGVRGAAALWSPLLQHTKRVSNQMMHMSDWLPTLYSAAGEFISPQRFPLVEQTAIEPQTPQKLTKN